MSILGLGPQLHFHVDLNLHNSCNWRFLCCFHMCSTSEDASLHGIDMSDKTMKIYVNEHGDASLLEMNQSQNAIESSQITSIVNIENMARNFFQDLIKAQVMQPDQQNEEEFLQNFRNEVGYSATQVRNGDINVTREFMDKVNDVFATLYNNAREFLENSQQENHQEQTFDLEPIPSSSNRREHKCSIQ